MTYAEIHEQRVRYRMAGQILYEIGSGDTEELRSEAQKRRKWVNRVSELRTGGKLSIGRFLSSVSSLLFSILYCFFGSRPGTNGVGTGFYHLPMEVEFPRAPDPPKGHPERY
jgi:hypothetical protein